MTSRRIADVPHYGGSLDEIRAILARGTPALFLDFDGVLAPIVDRPDDAAAPGETLEVVARLATAVPVAVVSGRGLDDVRGRVDVPGITYAGSHGFEVLGPTGARHDRTGPWVDALDGAEASLRTELGDLPGVEVERKAAAIAVHVRNAAADDADRAAAAAHRTASGDPELEAHDGKAIVEIRPAIDWHKGRVVEQLLGELDDPDAVPIYLGDDTTDEDAFAVVKPRGIAIVVRGEADERPTVADWAAEDPSDARRFLTQLAELVGV
ncbi:MAG: trehalose-phosphatase [Actinobacteria bacterium]|nr:trehalose-phosphatase [Actinomycetota bacterium]